MQDINQAAQQLNTLCLRLAPSDAAFGCPLSYDDALLRIDNLLALEARVRFMIADLSRRSAEQKGAANGRYRA